MLDRTVAPPFSHSSTIELPLPQELRITNELNVLYFDLVKQALIKIEFIYKAGKWYEPLPGLSYFTAQMLEKGAGSKSSSYIAEIFDLYGAHVEIAPGFDYTSVSLYSLSDKLKEVLPLFLEMLQYPSFPEEELELMKGIFSQNLKVNNEKNSYVASKLIRRNIFGPNHPYGNTLEEADIQNIHAGAMHDFFNSSFYPTQIYITGSLTEAQLKSIEYELKGIKTVTLASTSFSHTINQGKREEALEKQDSVQTSIRLGKRTINKGHQDFSRLLFINHILGGYFGSRLMKNIREEKGLTYGIYSSINTFNKDSFLTIGADVNRENQDITIQEIKNELNKLATEEIPEQELTIAKNHFIGSVQLDMANPFSVVEKIKNINLNHLDSGYYSKLLKEISEVSSAELVVTAQQYLNDQDLSLVKVG